MKIKACCHQADDVLVRTMNEETRNGIAMKMRPSSIRPNDFNHLMHIRNVYRKRPNFSDLASRYPDFRSFVTRKGDGSASIDFNCAAAVRQLTKTLLKNDFNLHINIPEKYLIPTVPLRLNYLLWIEDLLLAIGNIVENASGIDIGCGASCIYPLLACRMHEGWRFLATESDAVALDFALENVDKNGFSNRIKVEAACENRHLLDRVSPKTRFDFTMCNPPFFSTPEEKSYHEQRKSRQSHRGHTALMDVEGITDGGEVEFVRRIIADSVNLRDTVTFFTSMLGKRDSVEALVRIIEELAPQEISWTIAEFGQGRTLRWGLAWSFTVDFFQSPLDPPQVTKLRNLTCPRAQVKLSGSYEDLLPRLLRSINDSGSLYDIKTESDKFSHFTLRISAIPKGRRRNRLSSDSDLEPKGNLECDVYLVRVSNGGAYLNMRSASGPSRDRLFQLCQFFKSKISIA